jgi:hypothetical protein
MTTCNKARLAPEVLRLDIKDHVTADLLVGWRNRISIIQYLKCYADIFHLLPYCILPKSVVILLVKPDTVIPTLRDFNSKFASPLVIPLGSCSNATTAPFQHMHDPPNKNRGIFQVVAYLIFSNLNRISFFEVCEALPTCCSVFTFNAQVPISGCLPDLFVAPVFDVHISTLEGMTIFIVINYAVHNVELVAFGVTLSINVFSNNIFSLFITAPIWELIFISS